MAAYTENATSVRFNRENIKSLTDLEDLQNAYDQLCKDEVIFFEVPPY